jgi:L,D-peptidoglycan transpeptidase YkuD (ErfK/YbiS/YcfS/YnhG family)
MNRLLLLGLLALLLLAGCSGAQPADTDSIPHSWMEIVALNSPETDRSDQILLALADDYEAIKVEVALLERLGGKWHLALGPIPGTIGRNGFAEPGNKREGDGQSPSGAYPLSLAFGYHPEVETRLPYRQMTEGDYWVDDPASPDYNRLVQGKPDVSAEIMRRDDDAYEYGVVIEYNTDPVVPGMGSAIFLHVWKGADEPTAGCLAVSKEQMVELLNRLDPEKRPVAVMGVNNERRAAPSS